MNQDNRVNIRLSAEQKKNLVEAAAALGMSITGYLLYCAGLTAGNKLADRLSDKKRG